MSVFANVCPECKSDDVQCVDAGLTDIHSGEKYNRWLCWDCDADFHVSTETDEIL